MKRTLRGMILITLGLALAITAAVRFAMYDRAARAAGENAEALLVTLTEEIHMREEAARYDMAVQETPASELPRATLSGYDLVGIIRAPSLGLELPVLDAWSYDLLQIAPCRYSGSAAGGNLILLGHNYEAHFAPLKEIAIGAVVEFCDINGTVYTYEVAATEILQKTELEHLTASDYDLTLFTCTNGGISRFVVRCMHVPAE